MYQIEDDASRHSVKKMKKKGLHSMKKINALFWQLSNENEILTPNWKANRSTRRTANTTPTCSLWPSYYQSTWSLWSVEVDKICSDQCCIMSSSNVPAIDQLSRTSISDLPTIDQRSRTVISVVPAVNQRSCHREFGPGGNLIRGGLNSPGNLVHGDQLPRHKLLDNMFRVREFDPVAVSLQKSLIVEITKKFLIKENFTTIVCCTCLLKCV